MAAATHTLCKEERLYGRRVIGELFDSGTSFYVAPYKILWRQITVTETQYPLRFGVSVPKRRIKKAVTRNLIKRRTREAFRINRQILSTTMPDGLQVHLMLVYTVNNAWEYISLEEAIKKILQHIAEKHAKSV